MAFRLSRYLLAPVKLKGGGTLLRDHLRIYVRGGKGGQGVEKYNGIGGRGGDVYLEAVDKTNLETLSAKCPSKRYIATGGQDSKKFQLNGDKGPDLMIKVPTGVTVTTDDGKFIFDLNNPGDKLLVATGGEGGSSSTGYVGARADSHIIRLDLKLIADVGLVGFPNAGKSTLLKAISRAKPRIAAYPFTTIRPQLGMIEYDDGRKISVADLPGLIEGAYLNFGMGHKFLKHVERTVVLLFVVDLFGFKLNASSPYRSALESFLLLCKEVEHYKADVLNKPAVLCLNKMDVKGSLEMREQFVDALQRLENSPDEWSKIDASTRPSRFFKVHQIVSISAQRGENVPALAEQLRAIIDQVDEEKRRLKLDKQLASGNALDDVQATNGHF